MEGYGGCLVVVSHDRCFMDKTVDTMLILDGTGMVSGFVGTCSEYLDFLKQEEKKSLPKEAPSTKAPSSKEDTADTKAPTSATTVRRRTYKEQQEYQALEDQIMADEERKEELESLLSGGETDFSKLGALTEEYNVLSSRLEAAYLRWEELAELKEY